MVTYCRIDNDELDVMQLLWQHEKTLINSIKTLIKSCFWCYFIIYPLAKKLILHQRKTIFAFLKIFRTFARILINNAISEIKIPSRLITIAVSENAFPGGSWWIRLLLNLLHYYSFSEKIFIYNIKIVIVELYTGNGNEFILYDWLRTINKPQHAVDIIRDEWCVIE